MLAETSAHGPAMGANPNTNITGFWPTPQAVADVVPPVCERVSLSSYSESARCRRRCDAEASAVDSMLKDKGFKVSFTGL